jgi:hypothetical protein
VKDDLTAAELRRRLSYNPVSGQLHWLNGPRAGKIAGCVCESTGYVHVKLNGFQYLAHRLAWLHHYGEWPEGECDHRNRRRSENWIANLRDSTPTQNRANAGIRSTNTTGFKGVCFDRRREKYRADIRVAGRQRTLGYFDEPELAAAAYATAAFAAHGEFALFDKD